MAWLSGYGSGAGYRKKLTIDHTIPTDTFSNFAKLFKITGDSDLIARCDSAGNSLRVTSSNGTTLLDFGIVLIDITSGNLIIRVNVPTIDNSTDKELYLYYKSSGTSGQNKAGAVNSNTKLYCPLEEDPSGSSPQVIDWTSNANNGTAGGSMVGGDSVSVQVSKGLNFDGSKYVEFADSTSLDVDNPLTISFIANLGTFSAGVLGAGTIISKKSSFQGIRLEGGSSDLLLVTAGVTNHISIAAATVENLHQHDLVSTSGGGSIYYIDGVSVATGSALGASWFNNANPLRIGTPQSSFYNSGSGPAIMTMDELFIENTNRSAAWIVYRYTDHFSNSSTFTKGSEETESSNIQLTTTNASTVVCGSAQVTNTRRETIANNSVVVVGNVQPTNTRICTLTNSSTVDFSQPTATVTRVSITTLTSVVVFGSADSTGNKQIDAVLASSVVFGSALLTNTQRLTTTESSSVVFGSALATNTRREAATVANVVTIGNVQPTNTRLSTSTLSTVVVFGSADSTGNKQLDTTLSTSVQIGSALASVSRPITTIQTSSVAIGGVSATNTRRIDATFSTSIVIGGVSAANTRRITTALTSVCTFGSANLVEQTGIVSVSISFAWQSAFEVATVNFVYPLFEPLPSEFPYEHSGFSL